MGKEPVDDRVLLRRGARNEKETVRLNALTRLALAKGVTVERLVKRLTSGRRSTSRPVKPKRRDRAQIVAAQKKERSAVHVGHTANP